MALTYALWVISTLSIVLMDINYLTTDAIGDPAHAGHGLAQPHAGPQRQLQTSQPDVPAEITQLHAGSVLTAQQCSYALGVLVRCGFVRKGRSCAPGDDSV